MHTQKAEAGASRTSAHGDVAIVGMACLFPGASDLDTFWQNIVEKHDAIADAPNELWETKLYDPHSDRNDAIYCRRGGYLGSLAEFDPLGHGMMPVAVQGSDPDQWLALRVACEALHDAGYREEIPERERTAVILGRGNYATRGMANVMEHGAFVTQMIEVLSALHPEYTREELEAVRSALKKSLPPFHADTAPGVIPNIAAGRIANRLNLMGPSYTVDAACASSLLAVKLAVSELLTRQCDLALVGGVHVAVPLGVWMVFTQLSAFSRREQIRPFDKDADGTLPGEGVGMMVLKRMEDARRDGNRIYAVIKGVGTASDGRGLAVTAPRTEGEILALERAYAGAGLSPDTVGLIEAHGTSTPVGDAAELETLSRVFGPAGTAPPRCALGSVKSMIGHLMPAAGIASLIKTALALYHKVLPPTLHVENPHPSLEAPGGRFYPNTEARPWVHCGDDSPRRAGVNAFGFGGINAHAILEEHTGGDPAATPSRHLRWESEVCILSAASRPELIGRAQQLREYIRANPAVVLKDLAYTLNVPLDDSPSRVAIVASSAEDLGKKLDRVLPRLKDHTCRTIQDGRGIYFTEEALGATGQLAFLFPGEGSQYANMCADLCVHFPEVRQVFDDLDSSWAESGHTLLPSDFLFPRPLMPEAERLALSAQLQGMEAAISLMLAADRALFTVFRRLGISPHALVGHSTGEFAALVASGMIDLADDFQVRQFGRELGALGRSDVPDSIPAAVLVAVGADRETVLALTERAGGGVHLAMDNCPHQSVIVGEERAIQSALEGVRSRSLIHERLPFDRPYHTPLYGDWAESLRPFFTRWIQSPPRVRTYTCATASPFPNDLDRIRTLAVEQWRRRVEFVKTVRAMYDDGCRIFVEVGPRGNLTAFVDDILRGKPYLAVAADVPHRPGTTQLNHVVAMLAVHGVPMHLDYLYTRRSPRRLALEGGGTEGHGRQRGGPAKLATGSPTVSLSPETAARLRSSRSSAGAVRAQGVEQGPLAPPSNADRIPSNSSSGPREVNGPAASNGELVTGSHTHQAEATAQVMATYLQTVEGLVAAQEEVMRAFLARGTTPVPQQAPPQPASPPPSRPSSQAIEDHGPPASVAEHTTIPTSAVTPAPAQRGLSDEVLLRLVSERTGYPVEMLNLDLDLEADLGIDSIKRVEILGSLQQQIQLAEGVDMEALAGRKTLREVLGVLNASHAPVNGGGGRPADVVQEAPPSSPPAGSTVSPMPLVSTIVSLVPGETLEARSNIDVAECQFLADHTFGRRLSRTDPGLMGLPVIPLTMTIELMAEAAALLAPGQRLLGIRQVRGYRWLTLDEGRLSLKIVAKRGPDSVVTVRVYEAESSNPAETAAAPVLIEGKMIFGNAYPEPPRAERFTFQAERPSPWAPEAIYEEALFHGPAFQGIVSLDALGHEGARATLQILPTTGLLNSCPQPAFQTDPVLLDVIGQVVGLWAGGHPESNVVFFPFTLESLDLFGPPLPAGQRVACHVRGEWVGKAQVRADLEVVKEDGCLWARCRGWEDRAFELPRLVGRYFLSPGDRQVGEPWPASPEPPPAGGGDYLYRLNLNTLPRGLFTDGWAIWQRTLAYSALGRRERALWKALPARGQRRVEWLLGRVVAKDAVRRFLKDHHGLVLCPADIEILPDDKGRPVVHGSWADQVPGVPQVSIAHSGGLAVALVGGPGGGVGVDVEWLDRMNEHVEQMAFTAEERDLLAALPAQGAREWALRLWCAKEAVGKALGRGLLGGPQALVVRELDPSGGTVLVAPNGNGAAPAHAGVEAVPFPVLTAGTFSDGNLALATCIFGSTSEAKQ
jgi:acyl transferase domain-containing protein/phosphopantetheinyl transferase